MRTHAAPRPPSSRRSTAAAIVAITVGSLPVFLLGALAVLVRRDLGFSESELGLAVSVFFAASALWSVPGGWLAERFGPVRVMAWSSYGSVAALLGIGLVARTWVQLVAFLVLGGAALAASGPATNLAVARSAPPGHMGFHFGMKQSAVPAATLLAGFAVPAIGLILGWRAAFVLAALIGAGCFLAAAPPGSGRNQPPPVQRRPGRGALSAALVVLAVAAALGSAGGNAMTTFYVESAVARGIDLGTAGLWLAAGSVFAITGRLVWGWVSDRPDQQSLSLVSLLWAVGSVGFVVLAFAGSAAPLLVGTILAFGAGWAWNGLFHFSIVRNHARAPAAATGVTTTGMFVGGTIGPSAFGLLVHRFSYTTAWLAAAASLVGAALLVRVGRRMLVSRQRSTDSGPDLVHPGPERGVLT